MLLDLTSISGRRISRLLPPVVFFVAYMAWPDAVSSLVFCCMESVLTYPYYMENVDRVFRGSFRLLNLVTRIRSCTKHTHWPIY